MATTRNVGLRCRYRHRWTPQAAGRSTAVLKCIVCGAQMKITGKR